MKKLLLILTVLMLFSCKDEESGSFIVDVDQFTYTFTPFQGGAYMDYQLPKQSDIYAVEVTYLNEKNERVIKRGTYVAHRLVLDGFNKAQDEVQAEISLINFDEKRSEVILEQFSSYTSIPQYITDSIQVFSGWEGYEVFVPKVELENAGKLQIMSVERNPLTGEVDTLTQMYYPLSAERDTFLIVQPKYPIGSATTVVIRSIDQLNNVVNTNRFYDVEAAITGKHPLELADYTGPSTEAVDKHAYWQEIGPQYLFDGDIQGLQNFESGVLNNRYTFATNVKALQTDSVFTFDLREKKEVASLRMYVGAPGFLYNQSNQLHLIRGDFALHYPKEATLYGAPSADAPLSECVKLAYFIETEIWHSPNSWVYHSSSRNSPYAIKDRTDIEGFKQIPPFYASLNCRKTGDMYRYVKLVVNDTFIGDNGAGIITLEEIEIYVKKDVE